MLISIFVNHCEQEVLSQANYENRIKDRVEEDFNNRVGFGTFLDENYYSEELFNASEEKQREILEDYKEYLAEYIAGDFASEWDEYTLDV